jgi:hypothetical protein
MKPSKVVHSFLFKNIWNCFQLTVTFQSTNIFLRANEFRRAKDSEFLSERERIIDFFSTDPTSINANAEISLLLADISQNYRKLAQILIQQFRKEDIYWEKTEHYLKKFSHTEFPQCYFEGCVKNNTPSDIFHHSTKFAVLVAAFTQQHPQYHWILQISNSQYAEAASTLEGLSQKDQPNQFKRKVLIFGKITNFF